MARVVPALDAIRAFSASDDAFLRVRPDPGGSLVRQMLLMTGMIAMLVSGTMARAGTLVGVKGGVDWATIGGTDASDNADHRTGFLGGGFVRCDLNEQYGVQVEVLFVQKGFEGDIHTVDGDVHPGKARLEYVDVPLEFVARFEGTDKIGFQIFAGPSFNFSIKAEAETEDGFENDDGRTRNFEFGAVVGAGVEYRLSSLSILVEGRYSSGVTSFAEDVAGQSVDVQNRVTAVMVGVGIPLGPH